jgi:uncharacterized membrane protein YeaQ/YmgE (transglycosylase-associated protein family)
MVITPKRAIFFGMMAGSVLGGWLPSLWGAGGLTMSAMLFSTIGGLVGIWAGWKVAQSL